MKENFAWKIISWPADFELAIVCFFPFKYDETKRNDNHVFTVSSVRIRNGLSLLWGRSSTVSFYFQHFFHWFFNISPGHVPWLWSQLINVNVQNAPVDLCVLDNHGDVPSPPSPPPPPLSIVFSQWQHNIFTLCHQLSS